MFGFFENMTPQYTGNAQPTANNNGGGALGFLCGMFATAAPNYQTAIRAEVPATVPTTTVVSAVDPTPTQSTLAEQVAQPDCRVPLPIAIVIQRAE